MSINIESACVCHMGKIRKNNEDNFLFAGRCLEESNNALVEPLTLSCKLKGSVVFAIFDGMGGEESGEVASYIAASSMQMWFKRHSRLFKIHPREISELCAKINSVVYYKSKEMGYDRMGTTMVAAFMNRNSILFCNIGDSRAMRVSNGKLFQVTQDHSEILPPGIRTNRKPRLIQYIGIDPQEMRLEPFVVKAELKSGDYFVLSSDGLTDMVSDDEICSVFKIGCGAEESAVALCDLALRKGGRDNITIIVIRIL